jgi:hypothetical protein
MNDDVAFSISQFRDAWRLMCGACPGYLTQETGDVDAVIATHTAFIEKRFLEGH